MFSTLRHYVSTGNPLWGLRPPHNAPTYDQQPHSTSFFSYKDPGNLSMAVFFLSWYSSILTSYANQVLSVASSTFSGGVSLFGKLPLLYPWPRLRSYPYELTAGLYSSNGYKPQMECPRRRNNRPMRNYIFAMSPPLFVDPTFFFKIPHGGMNS
ncbi:hypothetical protein YC2023_118410 [Brassica napus]